MTRATTPEDRAAMCDGKAALTYLQAVAILGRRGERTKRRSMYHCRFCRAWHVGRKPKKIRTVGGVV